MTIVDDRGRLFGVVNVIDAAAVIWCLLALTAGVALVTGGWPLGGVAHQHVTVDATVAPYVAAAVEPGMSTDEATVTSVETVGTVPAWRLDRDVPAHISEYEHVRIELDATGGRWVIGGDVRLDFGTVVIDGVVTDVQEASG